jgi:S-methylmethionine-dependent homocysteine/selenocysteine methylase
MICGNRARRATVTLDMTNALPQLAGDRIFLTDGGLETSMIFHRGLDLPAFASFTLLEDEDGRAHLRDYFSRYLEVAREHDAGFLLDTATWRANPDWGAELGYDAAALARINKEAVAFAREIRHSQGDMGGPVLISGVVGPRGDGYVAGELMSAAEAAAYHSAQIESLAQGGADMIAAITMTYADEAIGIARAAAAARMPVVISFTVETDGRLPSGQSLGEAITEVDFETNGTVAYFMVNCAHPSHFADVVEDGGEWLGRISGLRANASTLSHAELDEAEELDDGNPVELGAGYASLRSRLRNVMVLGGCCGTDERHIAAVADAWDR